MSKISTQKFGKTEEGYDVNLYTITSSNIEVGIINYGATIVFLKVPDKNGCSDDVVTGFETFPEYLKKSKFFGSTVGRVANRIGKGKFSIDGKECTLAINNGPNALHGGIRGFDKIMWEAAIEGETVVFRITSPDGEEGYPGELNLSAAYSVHESQLIVKYLATSNKATPINITNHSYFNLGGHNSWDKDLSNHEISVSADDYLPADEDNLVTGKIAPVDGTVFDLRNQVVLTESLLAQTGVGFDHNFCSQRTKERHVLAVVKHLRNGRVMTVESTEPGVQLYTSNFLDGQTGKNGVSYTKHSAFCLESQNWPDAINHKDTFPDCVLRPGSEYKHTIAFKFETC